MSESQPPVTPQTEYATYLLVDDLLTLQRPLTPGAHDELLFIVIHQVYELWFKVILHELGATRDRLLGGDLAGASDALTRVLRVDELLLAQLGVLETMSPDGFLRFRDPLAPASGFQSRQFRAIEALSGAPSGSDLEGRAAVWPAYCSAARATGLDLPDGDGEAAHAGRLAGLRRLYLERGIDPMLGWLHRLAEQLLDHDEAVARWRHHHVLMAAREIGSRTGTGGSQGVAYLRSTLEQRFYPELWEVRATL